MIIPSTKYEFIEEYHIDDLYKYQDHRRINLFFRHGPICKTCKDPFTRIIKGVDRKNNTHIDLYNDDLTKFLTVGHIVPISLGGRKGLKNARPLCNKCNCKEGNSLFHLYENERMFFDYCFGFAAKKKEGGKFPNKKRTNVIVSIFNSPNHEELYFGFSSGYTYPVNKTILTTQRVLFPPS